MIYVLKTSVTNKPAVKKLKPHLDKLLKNAKWNFDLSDCDKILRIGCNENVILKVTQLLKNHNYSCKELA